MKKIAKGTVLPTPRPSYPRQPFLRGSSYRALARATDRYLTKAEDALRSAAMIWAECDAGLEAKFEEGATQVLQERHETVEHIQGLYGDRLGESAL